MTISTCSSDLLRRLKNCDKIRLTNICKYCHRLANIDQYWQIFANVAISWQMLAYIDKYWQILTNIDKYWKILPYICKYWQILFGSKTVTPIRWRLQSGLSDDDYGWPWEWFLERVQLLVNIGKCLFHILHLDMEMWKRSFGQYWVRLSRWNLDENLMHEKISRCLL